MCQVPRDLFFLTIFQLVGLDKDGNAVSLKRVEQITGKKIAFYKVDILDKAALNEVFKKVRGYCYL